MVTKKASMGTMKNGYKAGDKITIAGVTYRYVEEFMRFELQENSSRSKKLRNFIPSAIYRNGAGTWSCGGLGASTPRAVVLLFARGERASAKWTLERLRKDYVQEAVRVNELEAFLSETKAKSKK